MWSNGINIGPMVLCVAWAHMRQLIVLSGISVPLKIAKPASSHLGLSLMTAGTVFAQPWQDHAGAAPQRWPAQAPGQACHTLIHNNQRKSREATYTCQGKKSQKVKI